jgi:hypothetical protein
VTNALAIGCSDAPPEPSAITQTVEITNTDSSPPGTEATTRDDSGSTSILLDASGVGGQPGRESVCGLVPDDQDIGDNPRAIYGAGWHIVLIEVLGNGSPFRERLTSPGSPSAEGMTFQARVIDFVGPSDAMIGPIIEVNQWDAVVYADHREPMEFMDGERGRSMPRMGGGRFAVVLGQDSVLRRGWRLIRSWPVDATGALRGTGLGLANGSPIGSALTNFRRQFRPQASPDMWTSWLAWRRRSGGVRR